VDFRFGIWLTGDDVSSIQHDVDTFQNLFQNAPRDSTQMLREEDAVHRDDLRDVCHGIFGET